MNNMMYKTMRPKRSVVRDEFVILPEGAKCKHCHRYVRCVQSSNMKKHLRYCQPEIYKMVQEADGNFTYNPSPITMSVMSPSMMNYQQQYSNNGNQYREEEEYPKSEASVSFTSEHISSFIESQLASFKYENQMEDDESQEQPSSSPEEIPGSNNERYINDIEENAAPASGNNSIMMDKKTQKIFSSFDTIEINDGIKTYESLLSQVDPFLISKYFGIPVLALRLRSTSNLTVSRASPDLKRFTPPLAPGQKYQLITDEEANRKIPKCRIIIDRKNIEIKCSDYTKELIMEYMEAPQEDFVLLDESGNIINDAGNDVKLEDEKVYHIVYGQSDLLSPLEKSYAMPIEFIAGISINRSMAFLPPYLICISRAMHILTFIGEKFDLRTSTPSSLIGHTVANHAAQILCRLNDASKKIQFVTSNISKNISTSAMPTNSFSAIFCKEKEEEMTIGFAGVKLPTTDIGQIVLSLERALSDMENFLQRLKCKFQVEISSIQHVEMALKIDNGYRERKERIEEFRTLYGGDTDKMNEYKQVAESRNQICPERAHMDFEKVSESRKHFSFISKLMEKLLQSQKMGKFSFNDLAELLVFSVEVLHYIYLHWLFIKKFSILSHSLDSDVSEKLSTQFKDCSKYWYTVSQNVSLPTIIVSTFTVQNLWKTYYESIIKAQYTVESLFFAGKKSDE